MNKSVKSAIQISLGASCFLATVALKAQDEPNSDPRAVERNVVISASESRPESMAEIQPKIDSSPGLGLDASEASSQDEASRAGDEGAQLDGSPVADDVLLSESEPYWTPGAEPPFSVDPSDLEPVIFDDEAVAASVMEAEEAEKIEDPEESTLYQNLWSVAGANPWDGNSIGAAGFAPIAPPSGFNTPPSFYPTARGGDSMFRGFGLGVNLSGTYDSNILQSSNAAGGSSPNDFITSFGLSLSYLSQSSTWTFGGTYTGAYNVYANNSDFNGYTQSGSLIANYDDSKLSAALTAGISTGRGGNRFLGSSNFVEQTQVNVALAARYVYSAKTVFSANVGTGFTYTSGGNFSDTENVNFGVAALWRYSPLTEFGPGISFTRDSGGGGNTRTSVAPTLNLNYRYSSKLSLNSQVGLAFADYSQIGASDASVTASLGLNYQASPLWGMDLTLFRNSRADPAVSGSFREITAIRLGYNRKIQRVNLGLGLSYENSTASNSGAFTTAVRPKRDYFSIDGSIGMRTFSNTTNASIFMRYSEQYAGVESFDAFQVGFNLSRGF